MAVKTLYFKDVAPSGATTSRALQDGGTAPTGALTATGWTVARLTATNLSAMLAGTKRASTTFAATDAIGSFAASACWRSENAMNGVFANTNWSLAFRVRAATASAQTGSVKIRVWKSANADGSGATQLTSAVLTGTTTAALSTSASGASTVTWTPGGTITLSNEYLWVQCEWNIVVASGSNQGDVLFYVESAGAITTPDFTITSTAYSCTAQVGAIATSPKTVRNVFDRDLVASKGTIDLGEQTATTLVARKLTAAVRAINLNEQTAGLKAARALSVAAGALVLTGKTADLVVTEAPAVHHALTAQAGALVLSGQTAVLTAAEGEPVHDYVLDADPDMIELAGHLASLTIGKTTATKQPGKITMGYPRIRLHAW